MRKLLIIALFALTSCNVQAGEYVTDYGVIGNGVADDTVALQEALTFCSKNSVTCIIPLNRKVRITAPIFLYHGGSLLGEDGSEIQLDITDLSNRYVLNLGIAGKQLYKPPFTGSIEGITFRALSGPTDKWLDGNKAFPIAGRVIQFWRAKHSIVTRNIFEIGEYFYGATASQNNPDWMLGNEIHHNLTISHNIINQDATNHGQECIGIGPAQDITIEHNKCVGAGDDLIGAHFVDGLTIRNNSLFGVDGRIYMSDSTDVIVDGNHVERIASTLNGLWYKGDTLIYLGYEDGAKNHTRPSKAVIKNNVLILPIEALDGGSAITIRGASDVAVCGNYIRNDSEQVTAKGIWVAPWRDITTPDFEYDKYYVENVSIQNNRAFGIKPLEIYQTDSCQGYKGYLDIINNKMNIGILSCILVVNEYNNHQ